MNWGKSESGKIIGKLFALWQKHVLIDTSSALLFIRSESQHSYHREKFSSVALRINRLRTRLFWCNSSYQNVRIIARKPSTSDKKTCLAAFATLKSGSMSMRYIKSFCLLNRHCIITKVPQSIQTHLLRSNALGVKNPLLQISSSKGRNPWKRFLKVTTSR